MIIDVLSLIFVFLFAVFAMKKGAASAVLKLSSVVISLFVAALIYPYVTDAVYLTPIPEKVSDAVEERLISNAQDENGYQNAYDSIDAMPDFIRKSVEKPVQNAAESVMRALADSITRVILNIIVFAVLAAATKLIIMLLTGALKLSMKLPVLKQCNSFIGMLCGLLAGIMILWPVSALLSAAAVSNTALAQQVNSSYVVAIMSVIAPF